MTASTLTMEEIKQQATDLLFDFHDRNGLRTEFDRTKFEKFFSDKNIPKGRFDLMVLELEANNILYYNSSIIAMKESYYGRMLNNIEKATKDAEKIISLEQYQTTTTSITEITEQVLKNTNDYEIQNIAENLKASSKIITEKAGKVTKAFIDYVKKCLKALWQFIKGIAVLAGTAASILVIIDYLGNLPV